MWRTRMVRSDRPRARIACTKSRRSTSSTLARTVLATIPAGAAPPARAGVGVDHLPQPLRILDRERLVQAEVVAQRCARRFGGVRAEKRAGGITGYQMDQPEDDHGRAEEDRDQQKDAARGVGQHAADG